MWPTGDFTDVHVALMEESLPTSGLIYVDSVLIRVLRLWPYTLSVVTEPLVPMNIQFKSKIPARSILVNQRDCYSRYTFFCQTGLQEINGSFLTKILLQ